MCSEKEPSYFVDETQLKKHWKNIWDRGYWKDESNYLKLFNDSDRNLIIGESSTLYSKMPKLTGVPKRIRRFNKNARILYLMRDPIERTVSHYWHMVKYENEHRSPIKAIKNEAEYTDVSNYEMQLKPYFDLFDTKNIYTTTTEELVNDQTKVLKEIYRWLGVDESFISPNLSQKYHITPIELYKASGLGILNWFRRSLIWNAVAPLFPKKIRRFARNQSDTLIQRSSVKLDDVIDFLRPLQIRQTENLERLLRKKFHSYWTTLYGYGSRKGCMGSAVK
jgi:hypothetical protein